MDASYSPIFDLLTSTRGSVLYHLVLAIAIAGAFQVAYGFRKLYGEKSVSRLVKGLAALIVLVLVSQSILVFSIALKAMDTLIPPLDRMFSALGMIIIVWLWVFPQKNSRGDLGLWLICALIFVTGLVSGVIWMNLEKIDFFNASPLDKVWGVLHVMIFISALIMLIYQRLGNWELGVAMFSLLLMGTLIQLFLPNEGDFPGAFRVAQVAAYPFLFSLPFRHIRARSAADETPHGGLPRKEIMSEMPLDPAPNSSTDPEIIAAFLELATEKEPEKVCFGLVKTLAQSLLADMCLLFAPPYENDQFVLLCGFDLIREAAVPGGSIASAQLPNITTALERKSSLRLPANSKSPDLSTLAKVLNQSRAGSLLAHTILNTDQEPLAILVLLSPYSQRNWEKQTEGIITSLSANFAKLLTFHSPASNNKEYLAGEAGASATLSATNDEKTFELEEYKQKLAEQDRIITNLEELLAAFNTKEERLEQIQAENMQLMEQISRLKTQQSSLEQNAEEPQASQQVINLRENLEQANQRIAFLQVELEKALAVPAHQEHLMHEELERANQRIASLNNELIKSNQPPHPQLQMLDDNLENANQQIALLQAELHKAGTEASIQERGSGLGLSIEQAEIIASIAQDVRQPLSSITGYTDLLLGESVGILGALQKKFLERVKTSTERMNNLIDDLVQITALDSGNIELLSESVDLGSVFDDALANTGAQLREKNISLRVDMPDQLPKLNTDRDALLQIILHLLKNAGEASPTAGEISLHAHQGLDEQTGSELIAIQVTDTGGGIPEAELPRVFSRLYRADNPLIEGVGDTGVGLSIAKTLTEALGGKIWVETESGFGSTFNILLPLSRDLSAG